MKKLVLIVAAVATVISFSACKKICTCKTFAAGVEGPAEEIELPKEYKSCADMSTVMEVEGLKVGMECE